MLAPSSNELWVLRDQESNQHTGVSKFWSLWKVSLLHMGWKFVYFAVQTRRSPYTSLHVRLTIFIYGAIVTFDLLYFDTKHNFRWNYLVGYIRGDIEKTRHGNYDEMHVFINSIYNLLCRKIVAWYAGWKDKWLNINILRRSVLWQHG